MPFQKDLKFGTKYEEIALNEYIEYETYKRPEKENMLYYDFLINDTIKYEIKADRMAFKTKNLCIELFNNNKLSGLNTTEADYYIYFIINGDKIETVYKIDTTVLEELVKNKEIKSGGDNKKSKFVLLNIDLVKDYIIEKKSI
jgi:hypothetical protein